MSADELALQMLLAGDEAGVSKLARALSDLINNRVACPACDDRGPHEDNGATGADLALACRACGEVWEPIIAMPEDR